MEPLSPTGPPPPGLACIMWEFWAAVWTVPVINLGFSGHGIMEPEVAAPPCGAGSVVYVIDCLPNMSEQLVRERTVPLVQTLRAARPTTPIVGGRPSLANIYFRPDVQRLTRTAGSPRAAPSNNSNKRDAGPVLGPRGRNSSAPTGKAPWTVPYPRT